MKEEILDIANKLYHNHLTPETATNLLLDLFAVSGSLPSVDPLDDENSEIHKIGREIAEMSDEEFDANCKAIEKMLKGSKGNDR